MTLQKFLNELEKNNTFIDWKRNNQDTFLSHFFLPITPEFINSDNSKTMNNNWEVGYYNSLNKKVTVFTKDEKGTIILKNTDQVFKKDIDEVSLLKISEIKIQYDELKEKIKELIKKEFPSYKGILGNGFIILQTLKNVPTWNVSFITKKVTMINLKISATNSEFISKEEINFLQQ